jgi:hypothetical protein
VRVDLAAEQDIALLTLTNAITGLTLSYALRDPHVIQDAPWPTILDELYALDQWRPAERSALFGIFDAEQFTRGVPCAVCWRVTGCEVRLMTDRAVADGGGLFRAAICDHRGPSAEPMCCICGCTLRRRMSHDQYGAYDAVGCQCPSLAFDIAFDEAPWKTGVMLKGSDAAMLFEQP